MGFIDYKIASVPINKKGEEELDTMVLEPENVIDFEIPEEEYSELRKNGVFNTINAKADLLIDDYEEERIPYEALPLCNKIINDIVVCTQGLFARSIRTALSHGTFVDLSF